MNSKILLLKYRGSINDPDRAAALFAEDGALELPFLGSLGRVALHWPPRNRRVPPPATQALSGRGVRAERHPRSHRNTGPDARRVRDPHDRRLHWSIAPPTIHRLPGRRGRRDQTASRKLQSVGDGPGAAAEWSDRIRTAQPRSARVLTVRTKKDNLCLP